MDKWIRVDDRLPEAFMSVLGYIPDERPFPQIRECFLTEEGFYAPALLSHCRVTHWAEMPKPPKEG